jgi:hypothetical protein
MCWLGLHRYEVKVYNNGTLFYFDGEFECRDCKMLISRLESSREFKRPAVVKIARTLNLKFKRIKWRRGFMNR